MSDDVRAAVVAAALEWVEAHESVSDPRSPDHEALERYSEACNDLLAVVSQNRAVLRAASPAPDPGAGLAMEQQERFKWKANERADRAEALVGDPGYVVCGIDACDFAVERGEGRTMALHQSEDHAAAPAPSAEPPETT